MKRGKNERRRDTHRDMEVVFRGLVLHTAPALVMTPRPASEALVDAAVALVGQRPARVADVGTGSGAIAIALAAALPHAEVVATDRSAAAVALARANVCRLGLGDRVSVYRGDLLEPISGQLDLIVANLPYLTAAEVAADPDLRGEPLDAVCAPGDALDPYRRLISAARVRLGPGGTLLIQLRRRVIAAAQCELGELAAAFATPAAGGVAA